MPDTPEDVVDPVPVVVLISGSGSILAALIEACADPGYGVRVAAVGADRGRIPGLDRAVAAGIPTFVVRRDDYASREEWDQGLASALTAHHPASRQEPPDDGSDMSWVISVGFMKVLGPAVLERFRVLNSHPALLPAFPGAHAVADALAYGVKVTGATIHLVDAGVDTGPIVAQRAVPVRSDDDEASLHERIKVVERSLMVHTVRQITTGRYTLTDRKVTFA
ncbi:MAG: phosphoribosylglycinamide formyltransferase [Ornithinimicrobium sp.]